MRLALVLLLVLAAAGCTCAPLGVDTTRFACEADADCLQGFVCRDVGAGPECVREGTQVDAGAADAAVDAGALDAGDDAGAELDAGADAGEDAGVDAGDDAGTEPDAGFDAGADAGFDAGIDAGTDAGVDGGAPPVRLAFTTAPQTVTTTQCSQVFLVETRTAANVAAPVSTNTTLSLTSDAGVAFFTASGCGGASTTQVVVAAGLSSTSFFARAPVAGTATLTASATGFMPATQPLVVRDPPTSLVFISTPPASIRGGSCVLATVEARRGTTATPVAADTTVGLSASADVRFFTDPACAGASTASVVINGGASNVTFFMKPLTGGTTTVTAAAPFGSAMQTLTVVPITRRGQCDLRARTFLADGGPSNDLSETCPFSPAVSDLSASFLVAQATSTLAGSELGSAEVRCRLASTSTVTCVRSEGESAASVHFQVAEVPTGLLAQRASSFSCPAVTTLPIAVTPSSSFVLKSASSTSSIFDDDDAPVASLVSGTQVALNHTACSGLDLQVVQWNGVTVTRGALDGGIPDAGLVFPVTLPSSAGLNRLVLTQAGPTSNVDRPLCSQLVRGATSGSSGLTLTRAAGDAGCPLEPIETVAFERIDFGSRAVVREYSATFGPGATSRAVTITPVDVTRTLVMASSQAAGGQGAGETDRSGNARFTEATFQLVLTNATTVTVTRGEATSSAALTFFVLELVP